MNGRKRRAKIRAAQCLEGSGYCGSVHTLATAQGNVLRLVSPHVVYVHTSGSSGTNWWLLAVTVLIGVVAPIITGRYIVKSTTKTIVAERERLDVTLAAERDRLQKRLSFERGETDRQELRRTLDGLAEALAQIEDSSGDIIATMENAIAEDPQDFDADEYRARNVDAWDAIQRANDKARAHIEQLGLRLGPQSQILERRAHMVMMDGNTVRFATIGLPSDRVADAREARMSLRKRRQQFKDAALDFTAAELHRPEPTVEGVSEVSRQPDGGQ